MKLVYNRVAFNSNENVVNKIWKVLDTISLKYYPHWSYTDKRALIEPTFSVNLLNKMI